MSQKPKNRNSFDPYNKEFDEPEEEPVAVEEWHLLDIPVPAETPLTPVPVVGPQDVVIKLANINKYQGDDGREKYIAYEVDHPAKVYLVAADKVKQTLREQLVSRDVLNQSQSPYNWDVELNDIAITIDELRIGLYYLGMYQKQEINLKELVQTLISRGYLPIVVKRGTDG